MRLFEKAHDIRLKALLPGRVPHIYLEFLSATEFILDFDAFHNVIDAHRRSVKLLKDFLVVILNQTCFTDRCIAYQQKIKFSFADL